MNVKQMSKIGGLLAAVAAVVLVIALPVLVLAQGAKKDKNSIVLNGSTTVGPIAKAFAEYYMALNPGVNVVVNESGSGNGAKSLINGTCDIADMSRFMEDKEFQAAVANGVMPVAHVIAMDGIAIVVHPSNPVKKLTIDQVRDIYLGKIDNWKEVGGPDMKIHQISRDSSSGTFETFQHLVMGGQQQAADTEVVASSGALKARVQSTKNAIGYNGLGYVDETSPALEINGVRPTKATVASGKYPIARPLFMFTNRYPKLGSHLHSFITLYLTPKGQEIVESIGFVPVTSY